jgi:hypothetical protein
MGSSFGGFNVTAVFGAKRSFFSGCADSAIFLGFADGLVCFLALSLDY